jgi:hypothetical protein
MTSLTSGVIGRSNAVHAHIAMRKSVTECPAFDPGEQTF